MTFISIQFIYAINVYYKRKKISFASGQKVHRYTQAILPAHANANANDLMEKIQHRLEDWNLNKVKKKCNEKKTYTHSARSAQKIFKFHITIEMKNE